MSDEIHRARIVNIKLRMCLVMATRPNHGWNRDMLCAALSDRGWGPKAKHPRVYIGYLLNSCKGLFERVDLGADRQGRVSEHGPHYWLTCTLDEAREMLDASTPELCEYSAALPPTVWERLGVGF